MSKEGLVVVKWDQPSSTFHGVAQYIDPTLITDEKEDGTVTVLWPRKNRKPDVWQARIVKENPDAPIGKI